MATSPIILTRKAEFKTIGRFIVFCKLLLSRIEVNYPYEKLHGV